MGETSSEKRHFTKKFQYDSLSLSVKQLKHIVGQGEAPWNYVCVWSRGKVLGAISIFNEMFEQLGALY